MLLVSKLHKTKELAEISLAMNSIIEQSFFKKRKEQKIYFNPGNLSFLFDG